MQSIIKTGITLERIFDQYILSMIRFGICISYWFPFKKIKTFRAHCLMSFDYNLIISKVNLFFTHYLFYVTM